MSFTSLERHLLEELKVFLEELDKRQQDRHEELMDRLQTIVNCVVDVETAVEKR